MTTYISKKQFDSIFFHLIQKYIFESWRFWEYALLKRSRNRTTRWKNTMYERVASKVERNIQKPDLVEVLVEIL